MNCDIRLIAPAEIEQFLPSWRAYVARGGEPSLSRDLGWLTVLARGLKHKPYCVQATTSGEIVGLLPLVHVQSRLFGHFLVSLPYLNCGGVLAANDQIALALIDRAVALADELDVRYLELRHERPIAHEALGHVRSDKVHMRMSLPASCDVLWSRFVPKVRNQIRKAEKQSLLVQWGTDDLLPEFYAVFARNMRDLGTPVFSRELFASILAVFPTEAELCVVRRSRQPLAAGLLVHGGGMSEVLSAASLRRYNGSNANMLLYWHLLCRAIDRGQGVFDFGRSTPGSGTFRFKKQWGARPEPATWQYYVRKGTAGALRPESGRFAPLIRLWRRLPVPLTRLIGPAIVRGIP